jgi:hypothetical protein
MPDTGDHDQAQRIVDLVDETVIADPHAIEIRGARQFLDPVRSRVIRQGPETRVDPDKRRPFQYGEITVCSRRGVSGKGLPAPRLRELRG